MGAAGNAYAGGDGGVGADMYVVGNLHEVVDFSALGNHGIFDCTAVDGGIGADFHVVTDFHAAHLRDFVPMVLRPGIAEAVGTDHGARVDFHTFAEAAAGINGYVRVQHGMLAKHTVGFHHAVGQDAAAFAQHNAVADVNVGTDFTAIGHDGTCFHHGAGVNAGVGGGSGVEQAGGLGEIELRIVAHNQIAAGQFVGQFVVHNQRAGLAGKGFGQVFGVGNKTDVAFLCGMQRGNTADGDILPGKRAAQGGDNVGKLFLHFNFGEVSLSGSLFCGREAGIFR